MRRDVVWSFLSSALRPFLAMTLCVGSVAYASSPATVQAPSGAQVAGDANTQQSLGRAPQIFDRVKAVPKKQLLKRHRLELTPEASLSLNDGYYEHLGFGGSAVFYLHDAFALGLGASYLYAHPAFAGLEEIRHGLVSAPAAFNLPSFFAHVDAYWIPLYGKISLPGGGIGHFDFYASMGAGVATAFGVHNPLAVNVAVGQHYAINSWLALRFEVRDSLFLDRQQAGGVPRSSVQSYVMFAAGVSFFIPPTFEYTDP